MLACAVATAVDDVAYTQDERSICEKQLTFSVGIIAVFGWLNISKCVQQQQQQQIGKHTIKPIRKQHTKKYGPLGLAFFLFCSMLLLLSMWFVGIDAISSSFRSDARCALIGFVRPLLCSSSSLFQQQ